MQNPEIIGSLRSSYTRAVCMACIEKAIPYTLTHTLLGSAELFAIHPFGKMPVMRHGDFELYESLAIAAYLERAFAGPALFPSDPRELARTWQWISMVNSSLYGTVISYLRAHIQPQTPDGAPDIAAIKNIRQQLRRELGVLDLAVNAGDFLAGAQLTFADLNLVTILHNIPLFPGGPELLAETAHLAAYHQRLAARESYRNTIPPPGPPSRAKPSASGSGK
jgi:glutathione S-transferase